MIDRVDHGAGEDHVAVLRLAHGPVNAMDRELCEAIAEQFRALETDPARAVVSPERAEPSRQVSI